MHSASQHSISEKRIHATLVKHSYSKAMIAITGTLANSWLLAAVLWDLVSHQALITWLAVTHMSAAIRMVGIYRFKRTGDERKNFFLWERLQVIGLAGSGVLWGSTAIFLFPAQSTEHQVFIAFVLAGMVAGAVGVFSAIMPAFMAFSIPALTPVIVRFVLIGDTLHMAMGAMTFLFACLTWVTALRINKSVRELVVLKETFALQLDERTTELKSSEERFRTLADNISQFSWMADPTGGIFWFNKRWYEYTGTTFEEMAGWGWKKVQHPDHLERVIQNLKKSFELGEPWEDVMPLRGKDGDYRWFLSLALPIRNGDGKIVRWFGTNTDITERLQAERELKKAHDNLEEKVYERTAELEKRNREARQLAHKTIKAMENDRKAISRELHDSIGGLLAAIKYQLEGRVETMGAAEPMSVEFLHKAIGHLGSAIIETRRLTKKMRPSVLDDFGLASAVEEYIRDYKKYRPKINIHSSISVTDADLSSDVKTVFYRVLQEALNNVGKHSQATTVQIRLEQSSDSLSLHVSDDGLGFDTKEVLNSRGTPGGYGIHGMKERVEICNGAFSIQSAPGKGTVVSARIPLETTHE